MDGILIINKPQGRTSHDIVAKVKKIVNNKVGHTGTLDPNATGVLPLLIGKGTLCSQYLIEHDKIYEAVLKLGIKTDTADSEGNVIEQKEVQLANLSDEKVSAVLKGFIGKQEQIPPMYSAIKVNGKKLYEYARKGQTVEIKPRQIEIYKCELKYINVEEKEICFTVHCSKGTYIRSVCESVAEKLYTVGYMLELQRTMVGDFYIENSININDLQQNANNEEFIQKNIITIEKFFEDKSKLILNDKKLNLFLNGVNLTVAVDDDIVRVYNENNIFIGIAINNNGKIKRDIIL